MKTLAIPPDIAARVVHECPQLAALLATTDGRLELERLHFVLTCPDYNEAIADALQEAYEEGYEEGYAEGETGGDP